MFRLSALALVVVALAPIGCKATGAQQALSAVAGLNELQSELNTGKGSINAVTKAVSQLSVAQAGNLNRLLENYTKAVEGVKAQAQRVRSVRESLQSHQKTFVASWNSELNNIQSADLRKMAMERRDAMLSKFKKFEDFRKPAAEAFESWFQEVSDIGSFLQYNLTPDGVASLDDEFGSIQGKADDINASIDELVKRLGSLASVLESSYPKTGA